MLFSRSHPVQREETVLMTSDNIIKPTHCIKFLGLYIDERLDWQEHINVCREKLTSALFVLFFKQADQCFVRAILQTS